MNAEGWEDLEGEVARGDMGTGFIRAGPGPFVCWLARLLVVFPLSCIVTLIDESESG